MEKILLKLENGLGDKLLDILGAKVLCYFLNLKLVVDFNGINTNWEWGNNYYDENYFIFEDIEIVYNEPYEKYKYYLKSINPSVSLCPYFIYKYLKKNNQKISFDLIVQKFKSLVTTFVKPSEYISKYIPKNLENTYGVHLRKSDKVETVKDLTIHDLPHISDVSDFNIITSKLLEDLEKIISNEENLSFLITSEDIIWKEEFKLKLIEFGVKYNKSINFVDINYMKKDLINFNSVLDLFSLSKCKKIFQGIKHTNFSLLSSLLKEKPLINYSHLIENHQECLINNWKCIGNIYNSNSSKINIDSYESISKWNIFETNFSFNILNMNSFYIVATYPYNFSWTYTDNTTEYDLYDFIYEDNMISSSDRKKYLSIEANRVIFTRDISKASRIYLEKTNIETNFRIKIGDKYIRHSYGKLVCEEENFSELFKSDSTWIFIENKINPNHTFVISRYKENINWTRYLQGNVIIYNKGQKLYLPENRNNIKIIEVENVGREGHTYLYHIIQNYNNLTERITFLQANPFDHSPDLLELSSMEKDYKDVQSLSSWYLNKKDVQIPCKSTIYYNLNYLNGARYTEFPMNSYGKFIGWEDDSWDRKSIEYANSEDVIYIFLNKCKLKNKIKNNYSMAIAALFSVKKENILKNSLEDYNNLIKELLTTNSQGGFEVYILERIWMDIFI